ncbi:MAG TPA: VanW family protein, partial [Acidimicrobiia bacterium]
MPTFRRLVLIAVGALAGLAVIVLGAFFFYRWSHTGEVLGSVMVASVDLGGLSEIEAVAEVVALEADLSSTSSTFLVNGSEFRLMPPMVGFDVAEDSVVTSAMAIGREGGVLSQFAWWLGSFGEVYSLPLAASIDDEALDQVVDQWETDSGMDLRFHGAITLDGAVPMAQYPEPGMGVDRTGLPQEVLEVLLREDRLPRELKVLSLEPLLTIEDVDKALARARKMLSGPVTLSREDPEVTVVFSLEQLAAAFRAEVVEQSNARMVLSFDVGAIDEYLNTIRDDLEAPPRDAQFVVDADDRITILPSRPGTLVDSRLATEAVTEAAGTFARIGEFPFEDGAQPEITTEDLEGYGVEHLVSGFTTYHNCCECRVNNIHLIADEIDGALVLAGETFSINEYVGPRTAKEGYCEAGTIIGGVLEDTVGGGVSQFATTFYNAVFWGGYEDIEHKAHSLYISRYPEGIEGTISWPAPNLIFRNDSDTAVLIKTEHTDTSITVKFYGSNGGRTVVGEQKGGETLIR